MAKFKAKKELFELENIFFGVHKLKSLKEGNYIEITEPNKLPEDVKKCLEIEKVKSKPKKESK